MDILERIKLLQIDMSRYEYISDILSQGDVDGMSKQDLLESWDCVDIGDSVNQLADDTVSIYTGDLISWLVDNGQEYIDKAWDEGLICKNGDVSINHQIAVGQYVMYYEQINEEIGELYDIIDNMDEGEFFAESKVTSIVS